MSTVAMARLPGIAAGLNIVRSPRVDYIFPRYPLMQGYLFSRPIPAEKAYRMLERLVSHIDQSKVWLAS